MPRFIPAPAGNSSAGFTNTVRRPVHPRACGEQSSRCTEPPDATVGSSPHLRGTARRHEILVELPRFIPAPAGNRNCVGLIGVTIPVHPRACGEQGHVLRERLPAGGSSPRLRGTAHRRGQHPDGRRFIPAPAGNSGAGCPSSRAPPVHPRACGEQHWPGHSR